MVWKQRIHRRDANLHILWAVYTFTHSTIHPAIGWSFKYEKQEFGKIRDLKIATITGDNIWKMGALL